MYLVCMCANDTHTNTHTELACQKCKDEGKAHECVHLLHLVPSWQSAERHRKLKIMMQVCFRSFCFCMLRSLLVDYGDGVCVFINQDRPDLIQSELAGLAFDSLQQVFRKVDVAMMFDSPCMFAVQDQMIWIVIDPAGTFFTCMTI